MFNPTLFFNRVYAALATKKTTLEEIGREEYCDFLWAYYDNNGLYDYLRTVGIYTSNLALRELYNPANRVVEFYAATIWPGSITQALPLILDSENEAVGEAIRKLWTWSNWSQNRQVSVRRAAVTGDTFLKVAQAADGSARVCIQLIDPRWVVEKEEDERGYITYCRIEVPQKGKTADQLARYCRVEIWDKDRVRIWDNADPKGKTVDQLGKPKEMVELEDWGINFVPIVRVSQRNVGDEWGVGAFMPALTKIDNLNLIATRLHKMLYRHNNVTWALRANGVDPSGRPMPSPKIKSKSGETLTTLEVGDDQIIELPGTSELQSLVPTLDYASALTILQDQKAEIQEDLPEMLYGRLREMPEVSGKALRYLLAPAIAKAEEARGNHEDGLIRAHQMALTIGKAIGAWEKAEIGDVGTWEAGDYDHHFAERPIIRTGREEVAELATTEVGAGIPLVTSLRDSGWTQDQLDQMAEDKAEEQAAQQTSLASAVMNAQNQGQSNGLEQPVFSGTFGR